MPEIQLTPRDLARMRHDIDNLVMPDMEEIRALLDLVDRMCIDSMRLQSRSLELQARIVEASAVLAGRR